MKSRVFLLKVRVSACFPSLSLARHAHWSAGRKFCLSLPRDRAVFWSLLAVQFVSIALMMHKTTVCQSFQQDPRSGEQGERPISRDTAIIPLCSLSKWVSLMDLIQVPSKAATEQLDLVGNKPLQACKGPSELRLASAMLDTVFWIETS
jgi:hypothetical protein